VFEDISDWVTNVGHPGYANAAVDELFSNWTVSTMFAEAAKGKMSPEDALSAADTEVRRVFDKWRDAGRI